VHRSVDTDAQAIPGSAAAPTLLMLLTLLMNPTLLTLLTLLTNPSLLTNP
jgi:hypothetical protein